MITVYPEAHELHRGLLEPDGDSMVRSAECPERANNVVAAIRQAGLGPIVAPTKQDDRRFTRVHSPDYLSFLGSVWSEWRAAGETGTNARPYAFVGAGMRQVAVDNVFGRLGLYAFDATAPFVAGSWRAIRSSAEAALTAADLLNNGERQVFALCRPPGHHATSDQCGGYCYLNNGAIAAQALLDDGTSRVAVLDLDYHHGNGAQAIFYDRPNALTISLHADPRHEYPFFAGFADEIGAGDGRGYNLNLPLPLGTGWHDYERALAAAIERILAFGADAVVVALGLDTYRGDPTTHFDIGAEDYAAMGALVGATGLPLLIVLEGGYAVDAIGANTVGFLRALEGE